MNSQPPPILTQRKKILVVDDDAVVVKALSNKLTSKGYTVISASEPSDAVQSVRRDKPDLILLDITFPPDVSGVSWDGFRIAEWVKRMNEEANIPVIIITGGDPARYKQRVESIGAAAFFHKPFESEELLQVVSRVLVEWPLKSGASGSQLA